ncbi:MULTISPECIES: hypothetical protein [Pseudidiomarina]|uniref:Uncharacterized protein n=2 Tax=Pseudidiomarina TaxID=2800384 RepID=A0A368UL64_9GAMM|nr:MULTISPECIES: hypothetical protein [Pseudidiomarina]PWW09726.1 hypothetical protein DET45_11847 [Pseudidiomarina maritima]RBP87442.1 hypothetical protein DFO81_12047 [Pseudidiomarina tainanensis]RCW29497.1 hypothetical protein DFO79_11947 [Pseudidiomarina tainanensis]
MNRYAARSSVTDKSLGPAKLLYLAIGLGLGLATWPVASASLKQQDAPAQPMLKESYFDRARAERAAPKSLIKVDEATFRAAYDAAGRPQLIMLVGEPFSAMVSDWQMQRRVSINSQATGTEGTFTPSSQDIQIGVEQRRSQGDYRDPMLTPAQWQEYQRGYQGTLLKYGVRLVNRAVAMRLLDAEIRSSTERNPQDDQQRLEMDMLRKHTKLLIEVLPYREQTLNYEPIGYHISMTSMTDATLLADERIKIPQAAQSYRGRAGGYNLERERQVAGVSASRGGYQVIEQPLEIWAEQGERAAEATLQLLYDRYL